ncbi:helix-turn-helix domain-containing protein [Lysinibacillus capsici]|uniref:helix-turn-helix domain-containing protein n=1 Tax=Lysinibacillus capsici TaxID=2115968 RepID=UPI0028B02BE6|nr:helix-turn-helix transcriptional regulator [Lysinibacillus capsici]
MIEIKSKNVFVESVYKNGYSLTQLAEEVGMSQSNLSNVLGGRNGISPKKAKAIIGVLNVKFDDLFCITAK